MEAGGASVEARVTCTRASLLPWKRHGSIVEADGLYEEICFHETSMEVELTSIEGPSLPWESRHMISMEVTKVASIALPWEYIPSSFHGSESDRRLPWQYN